MRVKIQRPAFAVHVSRPAEVEQTRKDLPIIMMEQEIMEAINYPATLLYEAGFGSKRFSSRSGVIGITQPRCVAVLATVTRVAHELGVRLRRVVVFQNDLLLRCYSVIILDEAHERSLNTGFLLWMLTRTNNNRQEVYKDQQKFYNLEAQWHQKTKSSPRF
ncbi:hypothetical protein F2Q70_00038871 [Brassica cretica]|uniref:RNA helicase n=1 Tax=Brassica cretica TaxID=69181 RepID=A0A8S9KEM5_BRACR|nr:hypothetical protein F2Q70_00038871 [Brassica cretica]KAF2617251.1 hypothetical protein F2Q68_00039554 [Brassica cretica]